MANCQQKNFCLKLLLNLFSLVLTKDNIVTRLNIRVRYPNRVLSFHLPKQIPMRSKLFKSIPKNSAVFLRYLCYGLVQGFLCKNIQTRVQSIQMGLKSPDVPDEFIDHSKTVHSVQCSSTLFIKVQT